MEKILLIQNKHWKGEKYSGLIQRHILNTLLKKLRIKEVLVLLGIRRSGKSSIFKLLINHLSDKIDPAKILYLNLDDPFFSEVCKDSKLLYSVIETAEKLTRSKIEYLFLDEVWKIQDPELKREVLINYYETVVLKDCIANNAI